MRTLSVTFFALALLSVASPDRVIAAPDEKKLVSDYLTPHMPDTRRAEIVKELKSVSPPSLTAQLKKAMGDDALRPQALRLAIEFQVPGLFATARKHYEGADQELIIEYSLLTLEKGSDKFLAERWSAADPESDELALLQSAFLTHGLNVETINTLFDAAANADLPEARRRAAFDVVVYQCGADVADFDALASQWPDLNKRLKQIAPPDVAGVNVLRRKGWTRSGWQQWGKALRIADGGQAHCAGNPPPGLDHGKYSVTAHFWIEQKETVMRLALQSESAQGFGGYIMHIDNGKFWIETAEMKLAETQVASGKWIQLCWQVTLPHPRPAAGDYQLGLCLDGKKIATLDAGGAPTRVFFDVSQGSLVLGAVDYVRN